MKFYILLCVFIIFRAKGILMKNTDAERKLDLDAVAQTVDSIEEEAIDRQLVKDVSKLTFHEEKKFIANGYCQWKANGWYKPQKSIRCNCLKCTCAGKGKWDCQYSFDYCPYFICVTANWWKSFDKAGWSKCTQTNTFITGFYRTSKTLKDEIYRLEEARCCTSSAQYQGEIGECIDENWWLTLDKGKSWAKCRAGYFLNGLKRTKGNNVHNIEEGKCCRPKSHAAKYGHCYDEDIKKAFSDKGWASCAQPGHYVTGFYRHTGDKLHDIQKLRCCEMAS